MNAYPRAVTCTLAIETTPSDPSAPAASSLGTSAGSTPFTAQPGVSYTAVKVCTDGRWTTGTRSAVVSVSG